MNLRRIFMSYMAIPTGMMLLAAMVAAYQVNQEAENFNYYSATWAWERIHEPTRDVIRKVMADGVMSRWESAEVHRAIMDDIHMLMSCPVSHDCQNKTAEQARSALKEAMNQ